MEGTMPANYENVRPISRRAGADFTAAAPAGGQYRFCVVNPNAVVGNGPDIPGQYGGPQQITVDPGNVILAGAGVNALGVIAGKAGLGQPIEVHVGGRTLVICGGTIAAGDNVSSDANAAAITHSSTNHILGIAFEAGVAGDIISIDFARSGEA
jgi:hypothetical protein